jgi:N-methylhydantoinase A/oxoprolinase/acetone carboxylase beta subunit
VTALLRLVPRGDTTVVDAYLEGPTDYLWSTSWTIPADYPTGTFNYKVVATALDGTTQSWDPVNNKRSWLTVIPGTFEPAK